MKTWTFILSTLMVQSMALAGNFAGTDFNSMIRENQKIEAQLRQQLQKDAGISLDDKPGTVAKEKLEVPKEAEQVVVSSSPTNSRPQKDRAGKVQEKVDMERLSQELDEALSN